MCCFVENEVESVSDSCRCLRSGAACCEKKKKSPTQTLRVLGPHLIFHIIFNHHDRIERCTKHPLNTSKHRSKELIERLLYHPP